jgi:hypothetical protein
MLLETVDKPCKKANAQSAVLKLEEQVIISRKATDKLGLVNQDKSKISMLETRT